MRVHLKNSDEMSKIFIFIYLLFMEGDIGGLNSAIPQQNLEKSCITIQNYRKYCISLKKANFQTFYSFFLQYCMLKLLISDNSQGIQIPHHHNFIYIFSLQHKKTSTCNPANPNILLFMNICTLTVPTVTSMFVTSLCNKSISLSALTLPPISILSKGR